VILAQLIYNPVIEGHKARRNITKRKLSKTQRLKKKVDSVERNA
jgi:hypothetical protein